MTHYSQSSWVSVCCNPNEHPYSVVIELFWLFWYFLGTDFSHFGLKALKLVWALEATCENRSGFLRPGLKQGCILEARPKWFTEWINHYPMYSNYYNVLKGSMHNQLIVHTDCILLF